MTDESKRNGAPPSKDEDPGDAFEVSIPDELVDEAVKAVERRVAQSKTEPVVGQLPDTEGAAPEISVDVEAVEVEATVGEGPIPDDMSVDELIRSGHLPDRVVLAFEEERARAEEMEAQVRELEKQYERSEGQAREAREKLAAHQADADNFRKRLTREKNDAVKFANESLLKEMLPVADNLERALAHAATADYEGKGGLRQGVEITLRQFQQVLTKLGVTRIAAEVGTPFDPHLHEGVTQMDRTDIPANSIAQVLQPGYMYHDRLLRPAMVAIARGGAAAKPKTEAQTGTAPEPGEKPAAAAAAAAPATSESAEEKLDRVRAAGAAARAARMEKRAEREQRRVEEARERGGDAAAEKVAKDDADHEARAKARLERMQAAAEASRAARAARQQAAEEKGDERAERMREASRRAREAREAKAAEEAAAADAERAERMRDASERAREAREAKAAEADAARAERMREASARAREAREAKRENEPTAIEEIPETTAPGGPGDPDARARRMREASERARAARMAKRDVDPEKTVVVSAEEASAVPARPAAAADAAAPKPNFEDGDLDDWESTVDAMRTDTGKDKGA
ncbi:MAG TPA: nucleotide exchange factor GrpE [bacterium]|nr:nucleotide exchange factor GrpE [bacterium]